MQEHFPLSQDHLHCGTEGETAKPQSNVDDSLRLVMGIKNLTTTLLNALTKLLDACNGLQETSIPAFLDVPDATHRNRLSYDLPATYRELRHLKQELEFVLKRLDEFDREVSIFVEAPNCLANETD